MESLILELKQHIIDTLNLEGMTPDQIDEEAPLFVEGLGLDSIDALDLMVMVERQYGIKITDPKEGRKILTSIRTLAEFIQEKKNQSDA